MHSLAAAMKSSASAARSPLRSHAGSPKGRSDEAKLRARSAMLEGPVLPTLMRLALPTMGVLIAQTLVSVAETFYVAFLGADALVRVALVFPVWMLMTMMAAGGIGSGVASAIACASGAGRHDDADALVFHALVIAVVLELAFSFAVLGLGGALHAAVLYSSFIFLAALPIWIVNLMSAALRGIGNVRVPALVTLAGALRGRRDRGHPLLLRGARFGESLNRHAHRDKAPRSFVAAVDDCGGQAVGRFSAGVL